MDVTFLAWRELANERAGGSEVFIDRLASGLESRGHRVVVAAGGPVGCRNYETASLGGMYSQFVRAPLWHRRRPSDSVLVDVTNGVSFLSPIWTDEPSICWVNHDHSRQWRQWYRWPLSEIGRTLETRITPFVYRRCLFGTLSDSTREHLIDIGVGSDRIRVVPVGATSQQGPRREARSPFFVACGRFVPHKRYELLMRCWEEVRTALGGGTLAIIGGGRGAQHLSSEPGVVVAPRLSEAERDGLMASAWALVHAAEVEGWGLAITEAASVGTPAIGFAVPGVRDAVVHGETGLLAHDSAGFVHNWLRVARDPALRGTLGASARRRAAATSWDTTTYAFEQLLAEAIEPPQRSGQSMPQAAQK